VSSYYRTTVDTRANSPSSADREAHILALTLTSTQSLISTLFNLPVHSSENGPTAKLPTPTTMLPREKPVPKPKPPTKWERFAKEKGISHKKKETKVWDDEKQDWVRRWGRDGKNKEGENVWLTEVKASAGMCTRPRQSGL
jgi:regulator of ribosome biosynthesis